METLSLTKAKFQLGKTVNKYLILEILFYSFKRQKGLPYLHQTSKRFRQLLLENYQVAL
jgi:hypothetical protein